MCGYGAGVEQYSIFQNMLFILFPQHGANSDCEKQGRKDCDYCDYITVFFPKYKA
jgi:hypothetical protein